MINNNANIIHRRSGIIIEDSSEAFELKNAGFNGDDFWIEFEKAGNPAFQYNSELQYDGDGSGMSKLSVYNETEFILGKSYTYSYKIKDVLGNVAVLPAVAQWLNPGFGDIDHVGVSQSANGTYGGIFTINSLNTRFMFRISDQAFAPDITRVIVYDLVVDEA
jgi:hypothetical protein